MLGALSVEWPAGRGSGRRWRGEARTRADWGSRVRGAGERRTATADPGLGQVWQVWGESGDTRPNCGSPGGGRGHTTYLPQGSSGVDDCAACVHLTAACFRGRGVAVWAYCLMPNHAKLRRPRRHRRSRGMGRVGVRSLSGVRDVAMVGRGSCAQAHSASAPAPRLRRVGELWGHP